MNCRIGVMLLALLVSASEVRSVGALAQSTETETRETRNPAIEVPTAEIQGRYEMKAEDAPLEWVLENFLGVASGVYGDGDHEAESYRDFCQTYGIDSTWRSADRLGTAYRDIYREYAEHLAQARKSSNYKDLAGQDPNDWRNAALGEAIGEIYEELRADGLPYSFDRFVALIEKHHRAGFTRYSSEPFEQQELERRAQLFWRGAERVSAEAAQFHRQEVDR